MTSTQRGHAKRLRFHEDTSVTSLGRTRLHQPRMSLLGKPLHYRSRDARYRRLQTRIYNFLERPRGAQAILYHMIVFCMVFMCLALSVFSTIKEYEKEAGIVLFYMETVVVIWFTIEFSLRLWSSGCRSRYQGAMGRLKFLRRPFCIIDVTTILASLVVLGLGANGQVFAASALRGLRFFQILRMVRMDRRGGTWKLLGSVVYAHRQELITTLYIGFLGLVFASFLVYLAEKDANSAAFSNFADALWWGVITLCTVGYGDAVPVTWQGKLIASFCALLGISFFALPAGILGSGFALKVQQQQRQKHMIRRRQPAASLIQALWRCYAADENSMSVATWKIHMVPPVPSPQSFKHNASFVSRLPTIRRHKSLHSPSLAKSRYSEMNTSSENVGALEPPPPINSSYSEDSVAKETSETSLSKRNSDEEDDEPRCVQLTNQHKGAIRAIRKMKYFVARRKFKEALKPYDVKDVIEQYSAGHIDLLTRVKSLQARKKFREALKPYDVKDVIEQYSSGHADLLNRVKNMHFRLDQILGKQGSKAKDVYVSKISLASRVVKVERQVDDIEAKLDQLIDVYMEDRKRLLALPQYYVPSNPAIPPLNLNQWNPAGIRPDQKASDVPPASTTSQSPCVGTSSILSWPKPILVDKQSSEPNTPIAKNFDRPTQCATSQMGHKMKKRVTLSSIPQCTPSFLDDSSQDDSDVVIIVPSLSYKMQIPSSGMTGTQLIESTSTPPVTVETNDAMFTNDNSLGMGGDASTCDQAADGRRAAHCCYGIDDEAGTSAALLEKDVSNEFQDISRPETDSTVSHLHVTGDGDYGNRERLEDNSFEETLNCLEKDLPHEQV